LSLVPVAFSATQQRYLHAQFAAFTRGARAKGLTDQDLAEWFLSLGGRWLVAHGVANQNVHSWLELELRDARTPVPLIAAARAKSDFGAKR
jgi:hypothetical protein